MEAWPHASEKWLFFSQIIKHYNQKFNFWSLVEKNRPFSPLSSRTQVMGWLRRQQRLKTRLPSESGGGESRGLGGLDWLWPQPHSLCRLLPKWVSGWKTFPSKSQSIDFIASSVCADIEVDCSVHVHISRGQAKARSWSRLKGVDGRDAVKKPASLSPSSHWLKHSGTMKKVCL